MNDFKRLEIIKLKNSKEYVILETLQGNNKTYLYLNEVDKNEELLEETRLVFIENEENGSTKISDVVDEVEIKTVCELLVPMLELHYNTEFEKKKN
ncbi:MAG: hypothetical protein ACK5HL_03640 [Bacilli bacterium]